jgi:hypothetical protein
MQTAADYLRLSQTQRSETMSPARFLDCSGVVYPTVFVQPSGGFRVLVCECKDPVYS